MPHAVPDCTAPDPVELHHGDVTQILTAAEETATIVVQAIKTRTSLCIPGATEAGRPARAEQPVATVAEGSFQTKGVTV